MKTIYSNQFFRLYVSTGIDLSSATSLKIIYKDPDKITGEWVATLDTTDTTRMYYDISALTKLGRWAIYAKAEFSQGTIPGDLAYFISEQEGQ